MKFKNWLINEMPITRFEKRGDWNIDAKRQYGFNKQDAGIINSEKGVQKIHRSFSNSKQNFEFYFIRDRLAYKHVEIGEVSSEWIKQNLQMDIEPREDAITILFTNNTASEKIPMTAWTIAHRLGHAVRRDSIFEEHFAKEIERDFRELMQTIYHYQFQSDNYSQNDRHLKFLAQAVGTMRSAKQGNLRNFQEFAYELLAQYLITGSIKFNPLPRSLITSKRMAWGRPNPETRYSRLGDEEFTEWDGMLKGFASKYEHYLDTVLNGLEGRIFVM